MLLQKQPSEVLYKKGVLKSFAKFTWKHLWQSPFFNKVAGLSPASLLKKRLWHRYFPEHFAKLLLLVQDIYLTKVILLPFTIFAKSSITDIWQGPNLPLVPVLFFQPTLVIFLEFFKLGVYSTLILYFQIK